MPNRTDSKRYNLVIPRELFEKVEEIARENQATVIEILKRFIKLGLIASEVERDPEAKFLIREGETEREVVFL